MPNFLVSDTFSFFDGVSVLSPEIGFYLTSEFFLFQDSGVAILGLTFSLNDSVSLSDATSQNLGVVFLISDILNLADSRKFQIWSPFRLVKDSLNLLDAATLLATYVTATNDSVSLSDSIGLSPISGSSDSVSLTDAAATSLLSIFVGSTFSISDSLQLFDSIQLSNPNSSELQGDFFGFRDSVGVSFGSMKDNYLRRYLNDVI